MKIIQKPNVENDIVSVDITVQMLGTADLTAEQEKELISNYNKVIEYNKIQFKGNIKLNSDGVPEVTEDSVDGTTVVELEIKDIINERKIVNEDISFYGTKILTYNSIKSILTACAATINTNLNAKVDAPVEANRLE